MEIKSHCILVPIYYNWNIPMFLHLKSKKFPVAVFFTIFIFLLIFTRFFNLDKTARFIWDESSDLVRMHQFYVERKITLVGPINESGDRVYGSLTYYMLLPFAILGNFDPVSPAWGSAFWGIITALLLLFLTRIINSKYTIPVAILTLLWFPLIETSRWAWNPNLIPLWSALGILFFLKKTPKAIFLSGFFLGLTIHQHYLSLFTLVGFLSGLLIFGFKEKDLRKPLIWSLGAAITLVPFIIFDLRHPPGLFLTRILYASPIEASSSAAGVFSKSLVWIHYMLNYYTQSTILSFALGLSILLLLIFDIKTRSKGILFALPWILQIIGLTFVYNPGPIYYYYLLPSTIFFLVWILYPRQNFSQIITKLILLTLIAGGLFSIIPKITQTTWQTDIKSVRQISSFILNEVKTKDLKNTNIAVLESPDNNTYGRRYRDLLLIKDIRLKTKDEYDLTDHLFVVSTGSEKSLRESPSYEMHNFRSGLLVSFRAIEQSDWKIYHFTKNIKSKTN